MKILSRIILTFAFPLSAGWLFSGCGHVPVTGPNDTLIYFTVDIDEMPGSFAKAVIDSADKTFNVGTAWDPDFRKKPKTVLCYVSVPNDQPVYLAELHADNSGLLSGRKYNMYVLTPQESPLKVAPTKAKASIRYAGAYKFHLVDNGFLKSDNFTLERCKNCPGEKEALSYLVKISGDGDTGELSHNGYLAKAKQRLKSLP